MHLMQKWIMRMPTCILHQNVPKCFFAYIFQRKMFSIKFSKGKCSAKQNVTNAFDALKKYIFASHFVGAKMHLMRLPKCI